MKRNNRVVSLCGVLSAVFFMTMTTMAFAQARPDVPTAPPVSSDKDKNKNERSNKGGQLRGLDRADEVAGEHGQQGRETAREAQMNRPTPPERSGAMERPVKPERPGR